MIEKGRDQEGRSSDTIYKPVEHLPAGAIPAAGGYFEPVSLSQRGDGPPITLGSIVYSLWRRRFVFSGALVGSILIAFLALLLSAPRYGAVVKVAPASTAETSKSNFSDLLSGGGLSAFGLDLGEEAVSPFGLFQEAIFSHEIAVRLVADHDLMLRMFPQEWDEQSKGWKANPGIGTLLKSPFYFAAGVDTWTPPSAERVQEYITENIRFSEVEKSGVYKLSMLHKDAEFAKDLISEVQRVSDDIVRARDISMASRYVEYLNNQLNEVRLADQRDTLIALLSEQQKIMMLASVDYHYSAMVVDPVWVTKIPVEPNIKMVVIIFAGFGVLLGVGLCLFLERENFTAKA